MSVALKFHGVGDQEKTSIKVPLRDDNEKKKVE